MQITKINRRHTSRKQSKPVARKVNKKVTRKPLTTSCKQIVTSTRSQSLINNNKNNKNKNFLFFTIITNNITTSTHQCITLL
eukprot:UN10111